MFDILSLIKSRRSVRRFKPEPMPLELVGKLLEAARWAPSAGNLQPWFFYVVTARKVKEALVLSASNQSFIARAPVCIVACAEPGRSARIYGQRGRELYCYQDSAAAVQNILLAATGMGLGSCWIGAFNPEQVRKCLAMPVERVPVALICAGYPGDEPSYRTGRRELAEVVSYVE